MSVPEISDVNDATAIGGHESWRRSRLEGRSRRLLTLTVVGVFAIATVLALGYSLFQPFSNPDVHLVVLRAPSDAENIAADGELALPQFARNDEAAFAALARDIHTYDSEHPTEQVDVPTPADWNTLGGRLAGIGSGDGHVFLVYLSATGVSVNGTPFLEFTANVPGDPPHRLRVPDLLEQITRSRSRVKLLLLDARSRESDVQSPLVVNEFPRLLREAVEATGDRSLWVLNSHSDLERSHVSPAKRRSLFSLAVVKGLRGAADQDADGTINVLELRRYAAETVFAQVQQLTGHYETQTPLLCWGGGRPSERTAADILPVTGLAKSDDATDTAKPAALFPPSITLTTAEKFWPKSDFSTTSRRRLPELPRVLHSLLNPSQNNPTDVSLAAPNPQPAAKPSAKENPVPPSSPANIPDRLIAGWALRDHLTDHNSRMTTPIGRMPHLWRQLEIRLLNCELRYRQLGPFPPKADKPDADTPVKPTAKDAAAMRLSNDLDTVIRLLQVVGDAHRQSQPPITPIEKTIDRSLAAMERFPAELQSVGMAEWCHFCCESCLGTELTTAAREFDRLLDSGTRKDFDTWIAKLPADLRHYIEFRQAAILAQSRHLGWEEIRTVLAARRFAEQIAAASHEEWDWIKTDLAAADAALNDAERQLQDGLGHDYADRVRRLIITAVTRYRQVADRVRLLRNAKALATELQYHAGDLVRWKQSVDSGPVNIGPSAMQLTQLFQMLRELSGKLNGPTDPNGLETIRRLTATLNAIRSDWQKHLRGNVQAISQRLTEGRESLPGDLARIQSALGTSVLDAPTRLAALRAMDQLIQAADATAPPQTSQVAETRIVGRSDWERLLRRAELNVGLAELLTTDANFDRLKEVRNAIIEVTKLTRGDGTETSGLWSAHRQLAKALSEFYTQRQGNITEFAQRSDLSSVDLQTVQSTLTAARVLAGMQRSPEMTDELLTLQSQSRLQAAFAQQSQRLLAATNDAPGLQQIHLRESYDQLRKQSPGSRIPALSPSVVRIETTSLISLIESSAGDVRFVLHNQRTHSSPIRLAIEYDGKLLDVQSTSPQLKILTRGGHDTKTLTETLATAPVVTLRTEKSLELSLRIARRKTAPWPTHVILHVHAGNAIIRRAVTVRLPSPRTVDLHVAGSSRGHSIVAVVQNQPTLQPFPNRVTPCKFRLKSLIGLDRTVDVQLLSAEQPLPEIAVTEFTAREFANWSDRLGSLQQLAALSNLAIPGDGSWVDVKFPPPVAKPPAKKQPAQLQEIQHGLLVLIRDRKTGGVSVQPFAVAVQRPRRFLQANATFNLETRRMEIRIAAKDKDALPGGPVKVNCEVSPPLPSGIPAKLAGEIKADATELRLFADLPTTLGRTVRVDVHVDGFPRAFVFRVPTDRSAAEIAEETGRRSIAILVDSKSAITSDANPIVPAEIRVDAPVGSFENGRDAIDVGVDSNRNREFDGDTFLTLNADRQVTVGMEGLGENGEILIRSNVTDWKRSIDLSRFANRRVNLLGRLTVNAAESWSDYVMVIMDAQPPAIEELRSLIAVEGETVKVPISANDFGLSGVATVEAAVDLVGLGRFAKDPPPTAAVPGTQGEWVATLPLGQLAPGTYPVIVRATDRAGNVSKVISTKLAVLSKAQAAELAKPKPNRVAGVVVFDGDPIAEAVVSIQPVTAKPDPKKKPAAKTAAPEIPPVTTDEQGRFLFPKVPPGNYVITAKKLAVANKNRTGKTKIAVPALPQAIPVQKVELN